MAAYALQNSMHMKLLECCRTKEILWKVFVERAKFCGNRVSNLRRRSALDATGQLSWAQGANTLQWGKKRLESITHSSGDKVAIGETFSKEYTLEFETGAIGRHS